MSKTNTDPNTMNNGVILPAGPGANPSSFPRYDTPVDPLAGLPEEERHAGDYSGMPDDSKRGGDYIELPDGGHIAQNGAVIHDPCSDLPEVKPDHEYTPEKEDLNLLIM